VLVAADYLEYLAGDPHTRVIGCFIETVRQPDRFAAALDRAAAQDKPVVVLKVGHSERTRQAIATHTGGDAGNPGLASELLRAHRAIEVADLTEFTEVLAAAQSAKPPSGPRLGVITSSGGIAELILDVAAATGLSLPPLSPALKAEIERHIGFVSGDGNPLDAWGNGTFVSNLPRALAVLDKSPTTTLSCSAGTISRASPSRPRSSPRPISNCSPARRPRAASRIICSARGRG
jgi:acetate---CoA ligase (ADP-forming)